MHTLQPHQYASIAPFFAGIEHNIALVYGVLEGSSQGRVFADSVTNPTYALVAVDGAFTYLGGNPGDEHTSQRLVDHIFDVLLSEMPGQELVLFAFESKAHTLLKPFIEARRGFEIQRKVFDFHREKFAAQSGWRSRLDTGMDLCLISPTLAERYSRFATLADPDSRRFGCALFVSEQLASACTAVSVGGGEAEIDIFTEEPFRGRGLAALTACAFIEECFRRELRPAWSCWPYRAGSYALAKKLGFVEKPDVPALYWAPQEPRVGKA